MPHYTVRLDEAEIASQWIHRRKHVFQVVSNSCCRRLTEHHPGFGQHGQLQPKDAQSMLNDGANHPKYGWKMQNMSQTTNQVTIAAFFRPTRIDKKKNTPAI